VPALRIYTDESVHTAVAEGLRRRGMDAWSARDAGNLGLSDEDQLEHAAREHAAIFTHDDDFLRLAHAWAQQGKEHWGIIYVHEHKLSIGERLARLLECALVFEPQEMKNRVEFL